MIEFILGGLLLISFFGNIWLLIVTGCMYDDNKLMKKVICDYEGVKEELAEIHKKNNKEFEEFKKNNIIFKK